MTKLNEIERSLMSINEAVFQNLCDELLYYYSQDNFPSIVRTGSTTGKQKTRKGTPDTYFTLPNGRFVFVEYTTMEAKSSKKAFLEKATKDILKCLDESKTRVKHIEIEKIIFCHNSKLTPTESQQLITLCKENNVHLELKGIDALTFSLMGRCKHIAKKYLNISIDTGQVLSPTLFVEEYEFANLTTPLSNKLYGRDRELLDINKIIQENQITIVSGAPGVGKSRLVLEIISELSKTNKKLTTYCLSNKSAPIYEDLRIYLSEDKPYLIFIDDGNRQSSNLQNLIGLLKDKRDHRIQIVITVRDYALQAIRSECNQYKTEEYFLNKLSDEQIEQILKGGDFNINKYDYINRICDISNGNPRLAIMAAKVAIDTQDLSSLYDVYNLYDKYFESAIPDHEIFSNDTLLKTIGILSFFYSINLGNGEFVDSICRRFSINESAFKEALLKFEEWELAEINADNSVIKISDQVFSTYFFYRTFLRDYILDFNILLHHYFENYSQRFNDTVIAANSTFGYENVMKVVDPYLSKYWGTISNNQAIAMQFLKLFWLYRHEDILELAEKIIL